MHLKVTQSLIGQIFWYSQSEIVFLLNLQSLEKQRIYSSAVFGEKPEFLLYSLSIVVIVAGIVQKLWYFVISLFILKICMWNSKYVFTIQRSKERSIVSGRQLKMQFFFFPEVCRFFDLRLFILYQAPHSWALAPTYGALVCFWDSWWIQTQEFDA